MENLQTVDKLYHFYREECIRLARSLILKSDINANAMNKEVLLRGRNLTVDQNDKTTWRYYKHLAGEYHEYDHQLLEYKSKERKEDSPQRHIRVKSLDSLEMIDFTKENLDIHRATWRAYQIGTDYYNQLIIDHPELETLIKGILYPLDKTEAIKAEEFDILFYDPNLVNGNEFWLIQELNEEIKRYLSRWEVMFYRLTDDYYDVCRWGVIYAYIPQLIMNIRLKYANTIFAHSFHIWSYLASHYRLDEFKPYLTMEQTLWLYRNIKWVSANTGKYKTFKELIEYIMTKQRLPVSKFIAKHDISNVLSHAPQDSLSDDYKVVFHREQINLPEMDYDTKEDQRSLTQLMEKEIPLAKYNQNHFTPTLRKGEHDFNWASNTHQNTKILESHVTDYSNEEIYPLVDTLYYYFVWSTVYSRYTVQINVTNPSSLDFMTMNTKEALIVLNYCMARVLQHEDPDYIPSIYARDIYYPVLTNDIVDKLKEHVDDRANIEEYIRYIKDVYPPFGLIQSTEEFYLTVHKIHEFRYKMRDLVGFIDDLGYHNEVKAFVESLKVDYWVPLHDKGVTYHQYFRDRGWNILKLKEEDYLTLGTQILNKVTGMDLHESTSVASVQKAMIRLMEKLSSYTIHFISSINSQDVLILDPPAPRIGLLEYEDTQHIAMLKRPVTVENIKAHEMMSMNAGIGDLFDENQIPDQHEDHHLFVDTELTVDKTAHDITFRHQRVQGSYINVLDIQDINPSEKPKHRYWLYNGTLFSDKLDEVLHHDAKEGEEIEIRHHELLEVEISKDKPTITLARDINYLITQHVDARPWRSQVPHVIENHKEFVSEDEYELRDWGIYADPNDRPSATFDRDTSIVGEDVLDEEEMVRQDNEIGTISTDLDRMSGRFSTRNEDRVKRRQDKAKFDREHRKQFPGFDHLITPNDPKDPYSADNEHGEG